MEVCICKTFISPFVSLTRYLIKQTAGVFSEPGRQGFPIIREHLLDVNHSLMEFIHKRIFSPIPHISRYVVFFRKNLAYILTRNIQRRIVIDKPVFLIRSSHQKVGILIIELKVFQTNFRKRKSRYFRNGIRGRVARSYVNVRVNDTVFGFANSRMAKGYMSTSMTSNVNRELVWGRPLQY